MNTRCLPIQGTSAQSVKLGCHVVQRSSRVALALYLTLLLSNLTRAASLVGCMVLHCCTTGTRSGWIWWVRISTISHYLSLSSDHLVRRQGSL